jgi:ribosomal protein L7/L12
MEVEWPTYTLWVSPGGDRLRVMTVIRTLRPDLGLADAKALVDAAPQIVKHAVGHFDVQMIKSRFLDVGAVVAFRSESGPHQP